MEQHCKIRRKATGEFYQGSGRWGGHGKIYNTVGYAQGTWSQLGFNDQDHEIVIYDVRPIATVGGKGSALVITGNLRLCPAIINRDEVKP